MSIVGSIIQSSGGGGAGGATDARVDNLEYNLAINTLNDVIVEGRTVFEMVDQVSDGFTDETGIDTVNSVALYVASSDYYKAISDSDIIIHSDTTNGSTTFSNSGSATCTVLPVGAADHSTAQQKFGATSIDLTLTADWLTLSNSTSFDVADGDFTFDGWFRMSSTAATSFLTSSGDLTSGNAHWGVVFYAGTFRVFSQEGIGGNETSVLQKSWTPSTDTWYHIAVVREGDVFTAYIDGTSIGTNTVSAGYSMHYDAGSTPALGSDSSIYDSNYYADEIRLIKGTAVWTGDFTPPTSPYEKTEMTLISEGFTADVAPTHARLTVLFDPVDAVTLNTDLIFSVSIDDGTTFATATMEYVQDYTSDIRILTCDEIDLSGITSGTEVVIKAVTANEKELKIHGWVVQWR